MWRLIFSTFTMSDAKTILIGYGNNKNNNNKETTRTQSAMMRQPSWSTMSTSMAEGGVQKRCWKIWSTDSTVRFVSFMATAMWPSVRIVLSSIIVDSLQTALHNNTSNLSNSSNYNISSQLVDISTTAAAFVRTNVCQLSFPPKFSPNICLNLANPLTSIKFPVTSRFSRQVVIQKWANHGLLNTRE